MTTFLDLLLLIGSDTTHKRQVFSISKVGLCRGACVVTTLPLSSACKLNAVRNVIIVTSFIPVTLIVVATVESVVGQKHIVQDAAGQKYIVDKYCIVVQNCRLQDLESPF
jgi:hypothetical protein